MTDRAEQSAKCKVHKWPDKYRFMTVDEIADLHGVSRRTVVYWAKKGWPSRDPDRHPRVRG